VATIVMATDSAGVVVKVIEESEERPEGGNGIVGDECSWEERHFACCLGFDKSSFNLSDW
jgi:hypothetical protein